MARTVRHPLFARVYGFTSRGAERVGVADNRDRLLEGMSGRVLEIGAGSGLNFAHYPRSVSEVVALEPEPYLRKLALRQALEASVPIMVIDGLAEAVPFPDAHFDGVVTALVLCSVADQMVALREIRRVLKPGGSMRYYEHVVSHRPRPARIQRLMDATLWPRIAGGCHLARDTGAAIRAAGFTVEREQRLPVKSHALEPAIPHLLGAARPALAAD
jgi:ubiquinone/menaquinone biosynthesis C-methylase UbiE